MFSIGDTAEFYGKTYQITGYLFYSGYWHSWDHEDNGWYSESWSFDEWVLVNEDKEYLYICEDEEAYSLSRAFTPSHPGIPENLQRYFSLTDSGGYPTEYFDGRLEYFDGELSWIPVLHENLMIAEYQSGGSYYSAEKRSIDSEVKEVEFFQSRKIKGEELARTFNKKLFLEKFEKQKHFKRELKHWSGYSFATFALLMILGLMGSFSSGSTIFSETITPPFPDSGVVYGPIAFDEQDSLYQISLRASGLPWNSWSWGGVELLNEEQLPINAIQHDFWKETGRDSDGQWSETSLSKEILFTLEQPGNYYLRVHGDIGNARSPAITVSVGEGAGSGLYYFFSAAVALVLGIFLILQAPKTNSSKDY